MEYALDQSVIFEHFGKERTGKITGEHGENFIVTLDEKMYNGVKTILVPSGSARPLTCYWCRDTQKVAATPVTVGQIESGEIPQVECPYCVK